MHKVKKYFDAIISSIFTLLSMNWMHSHFYKNTFKPADVLFVFQLAVDAFLCILALIIYDCLMQEPICTTNTDKCSKAQIKPPFYNRSKR